VDKDHYVWNGGVGVGGLRHAKDGWPLSPIWHLLFWLPFLNVQTSNVSGMRDTRDKAESLR
jgi:hypothetical protein